jgi:hypothetical protein
VNLLLSEVPSQPGGEEVKELYMLAANLCRKSIFVMLIRARDLSLDDFVLYAVSQSRCAVALEYGLVWKAAAEPRSLAVSRRALIIRALTFGSEGHHASPARKSGHERQRHLC